MSMRKAILWCALSVAAVALVATSIQAQDHAYAGADKCKMCHKVQYTSWQETTHAKATEAAKGSTDPAFEAKCLQCHATNASEDFPGVQCEACHGPGEDYKKMSIMKDLDAAIANGLIIPTQETCNTCHMDNGHSKAVDLKANLGNKAAIHEFKNPPGE
jgi:hypothetical protein